MVIYSGSGKIYESTALIAVMSCSNYKINNQDKT